MSTANPALPKMFPIFDKLSASSTKMQATWNEEDLQCPVCFERFDDNSRAPIGATGCRHSICKTCLHDMVAYRNDGNQQQQRQQRRLSSRRAAPNTSSLFDASARNTSSFSNRDTNSNGNISFNFNYLCKHKCPTCRDGTFSRTHEPHAVAIVLLKKIQAMEAGRSRRKLRGRNFRKRNIDTLRQGYMQNRGNCSCRDETAFFKDRMLALEAENVALRAENSELHEGENAKQSITDFLLKDCEDKLANSLAKRRDEQETHEAVVDAKDSVIRELQADRDKSLDTIKTTLAKIKLYKAKYESMSTTAKSNQKEAEKTQRMLFLALVAVVIFAFLATVYALVVSASSSKDSLAQCQNMI